MNTPLRILVMGLPGSGKTTFVENLKKLTTNFDYYNAHTVRHNDDNLDFTLKGREQQARRMRHLCDQSNIKERHAITDFVCPLVEFRSEIVQPDVLIWMNTIDESRHKNTNDLFETPRHDDFLHPMSVFFVENYNYNSVLNYLYYILEER
jgi:septin family protein